MKRIAIGLLVAVMLAAAVAKADAAYFDCDYLWWTFPCWFAP